MAVTAYKFPGSTNSNVSDSGSSAWVNIGNITSDNGVYATSGNLSGWGAANTWAGIAYNFGFTTSDIPTGSTIDGIEVVVNRRRTGAGNIQEQKAGLTLNGSSAFATMSGIDQADTSTNWATSDEDRTFGGASNIMYGSALTVANVTSSDFGWFYRAKGNASFPTQGVGEWDSVKMRIYYTPPATVIASAFFAFF